MTEGAGGAGRLVAGTRLRVLVACEFSGRVRDAFAALGHDAWSADLLPSEAPGQHLQGDVREVLGAGWDLMVCHPPCTDLAVSGARWFAAKGPERYAAAVAFARDLWAAPIERVALENPVSRLTSAWRRPDQVVQPWWFGDGAVKSTCLWLRGLPLLYADRPVPGRRAESYLMSPGPDRGRDRSRTYLGVARAMAAQWSAFQFVGLGL